MGWGMSGSSGSRSRDEGDYGGGGGEDDCSKSYKGPINSPKATVLAGSKPGDKLELELDERTSRTILLVKVPKKGVAGSLTFLGYLKIIECIKKGVEYNVTITSISGGAYHVLVEPV